jgi:hypothetical protein
MQTFRFKTRVKHRRAKSKQPHKTRLSGRLPLRPTTSITTKHTLVKPTENLPHNLLQTINHVNPPLNSGLLNPTIVPNSITIPVIPSIKDSLSKIQLIKDVYKNIMFTPWDVFEQNEGNIKKGITGAGRTNADSSAWSKKTLSKDKFDYTLFVDAGGLAILKYGDPNDARSSSEMFYNFVGLTHIDLRKGTNGKDYREIIQVKPFSDELKTGITQNNVYLQDYIKDVTIHAMHVAGPNFNNDMFIKSKSPIRFEITKYETNIPTLPDEIIISTLIETYTNIITNFINSKFQVLRMPPISTGVFMPNNIKYGYMLLLTMKSILKTIEGLSIEQLNILLNKNKSNIDAWNIDISKDTQPYNDLLLIKPLPIVMCMYSAISYREIIKAHNAALRDYNITHGIKGGAFRSKKRRKMSNVLKYKKVKRRTLRKYLK